MVNYKPRKKIVDNSWIRGIVIKVNKRVSVSRDTDAKKQKQIKRKKMKLLKTLLGVVLATSLFTVAALGADTATTAPVVAKATVTDPSQWTFSLAGSGVVGTKSDTTFNGGLSLELGHTGKFILPLEAGIRQGIGLNYDNGSTWKLSTSVYNEWQLVKLGSLEFDAGGNAGVAYGNNPLAWTVGPEATARLWLTQNVNTFLRGQYEFDVSNNSVHSQNALGIVFGIQARF